MNSPKQPKLIKTYTIITPIDEFNIVNGKCPNYALNWGIQRNLRYWSTGHDFINGKYNSKKEYTFPKNSITIFEYDKLRRQKEEYERGLLPFTRVFFQEKRESMKSEMEEYLHLE